MRFLGCIWTAVQTRGIPDGWHLEGTGSKGRLLAVQGSGPSRAIRPLVKIAQVARSGHAEVFTMAGTDEFLRYAPGTMSKVLADAMEEADLRPKQ